jgi:hypothetical protein
VVRIHAQHRQRHHARLGRHRKQRQWYDTSGGWPFLYPGEIPLVGDFNGDGRDDIAVCTRGATADAYVALSTGRGFARQTLWHGDFCAGTAVPKGGDVNGEALVETIDTTKA